jgi:hypothetical protein
MKNILLSCELDRFYVDNLDTKSGISEFVSENKWLLIFITLRIQVVYFFL